MDKPRSDRHKSEKSKGSELFERAYKEWKRRNLRPALRLFRSAAEAGDKGALVNIGYFYDRGIGVRRDLSKALYWYKRAYRRGDSGAANNIGTIWRDQQKMKRALSWFQKAVKLGDDGSNLEIAKYYLRNERDPTKALGYLNKVRCSNRVAEVELEEANRLLKEARRKLGRA
jgi:TPR repeat protein